MKKIKTKGVQPSKILAKKYEMKIRGLIIKAEALAIKKISETFSPFVTDASLISQVRIMLNALKKEIDFIFNSQTILADFIGEVNKDVTIKAKASLVNLDFSIKKDISPKQLEIIKGWSVQNATLIKSIGTQFHDKISSMVLQQVTSGNGLKDTITKIKEIGKVSQARARGIAKKETEKLTAQLNRAKMEDVGISQFIWVHSHASVKPREQHLAYDGQIFSYDDLPEIEEDGTTGLPGEAFGCGCFAKPYIKGVTE